MKTKKAIIPIIFVAALIICLLGWRLRPHSLAEIISVEKNALISLACQVTVMSVENGEQLNRSYTLSELSPQDIGFEKIVEILASSDFRQDFRNLLPRSKDIVLATDTNRSAQFVLVWGKGENEICFLWLHDESTIAVSSGTEAGIKVYHPTNRELLGSLIEYMQEHGNEG